jgi:ABC-type transport system substrate-binding protein
MCSRQRGSVALPFPPDRIITRRWSKHYTNWTHCNDPVYDKIYDDFLATADFDEQRRLVGQAVDYALTQHWSVNVLPTVSFMVYQPWFKGYGYGGDITTVNWDRCWIDNSMK